MTRDPFIEDGIGSESKAESGEVLRRGLQTRADLFTISSPPIAAVRRRAQRRRRRRGVIQGVSGLAVMCAVVGGVVAWSPARDEVASTAAGSRVESSPTPSPPLSSAPPTTSASNYLLASDLGAGWTGPDSAASRPGLALYGPHCTDEGYFPPQKSVTPAPNKIYYQYSAPGQVSNETLEAIYTFAAGTGPALMDKARTALAAGCGTPQYVKLLGTPSTVADEAIVFTTGGDGCNILVQSGDRVASAAVDRLPKDQDKATWMDQLAKQMAIRLTAR